MLVIAFCHSELWAQVFKLVTCLVKPDDIKRKVGRYQVSEIKHTYSSPLKTSEKVEI